MKSHCDVSSKQQGSIHCLRASKCLVGWQSSLLSTLGYGVCIHLDGCSGVCNAMMHAFSVVHIVCSMLAHLERAVDLLVHLWPCALTCRTSSKHPHHC